MVHMPVLLLQSLQAALCSRHENWEAGSSGRSQWQVYGSWQFGTLEAAAEQENVLNKVSSTAWKFKFKINLFLLKKCILGQKNISASPQYIQLYPFKNAASKEKYNVICRKAIVLLTSSLYWQYSASTVCCLPCLLAYKTLAIPTLLRPSPHAFIEDQF